MVGDPHFEGLVEQVSILASLVSDLAAEIAILKGQTPLRSESKHPMAKAALTFKSSVLPELFPASTVPPPALPEPDESKIM